MLRRYAVVAVSASMDIPTTDWLSVPKLPSPPTQSTRRVCGGDGSQGTWVIGRGPTHEVERTDLPTALRQWIGPAHAKALEPHQEAHAFAPREAASREPSRAVGAAASSARRRPSRHAQGPRRLRIWRRERFS